MKKTASILLFLCVVSFSLFAQNKKNDSIVFTYLTYDYGTIEVGSPGKCEFKFTNKKETPLVLSKVRAACGCTTPEWPKDPIFPGKTGIITVKYNTNSIGQFNKTITVNSNAVNSNVVLRIRGNVVKSK
ncbi:MAG: DUF1573 domain-containing protein [Bacteroidales bacterium]|nr:DUF1573 domain-containing protein [Bacteroidales bacterium]